MNIIVKTAEGKFLVRPDTTWEKDSEDFYPPEFVQKLTYTPVLFARICKPGRSISKSFSQRYYDGIGYGVLLYPENLIDGSETGLSTASMLDHTSFLPFPMYHDITLGNKENEFRILDKVEGQDPELLFQYNEGTAEMINQAISEATSLIYIRTGDLLAIELQQRKPLLSSEDKKDHNIKAYYCNNLLLDFNIVL